MSLPAAPKIPKAKVLPDKYYADAAGNYVGTYGGIQTDEDDPSTARYAIPDDLTLIEVPSKPNNRRDKWDGVKWVPQPAAPRDLDAELATYPDYIQALIQLLPGGVAAWKTQMAAK